MFKSVWFWRRLTQVAFLGLLVYGGYLFGGSLGVFGAGGAAGAGGAEGERLSGSKAARSEAIYWVPKQPSVIDAYPPAAVCKFNPRGGLLAACPVYFANDKLTWLYPLRHLLAYVFIFFLLGLLLSRLWCGWICPLGTIEDGINYVRKKLGMGHVDFSPGLRRWVEVSKYSLLGLSVAISGLIAIPALKEWQCYFFLPFCQLCPGRILFPLFDGTVPKVNDFSAAIPGTFSVLAWTFLGIFLLGSFLGRRIWCRLCPIGACHEFFNRGGLLALKKDAVKCNRCGVCAYACPIEHRGVYEEKELPDVSHRDCILCLRCVEMCPKNDCLKLEFLGRPLVGSSFKEARR